MIRNDDRVVPQLLGLDRTRSQLRPGNDLTHTCKETKRPHEPQYRGWLGGNRVTGRPCEQTRRRRVPMGASPFSGAEVTRSYRSNRVDRVAAEWVTSQAAGFGGNTRVAGLTYQAALLMRRSISHSAWPPACRRRPS